MSEKTTTILTADMPTPFSWMTELLQRLPSHTFMAGLFVYAFLVVLPERESWYWQQIEGQRKEQIAARIAYEDRKDAQLRELEKECHDTIAEDFGLSKENHRLLTDNTRQLQNLIDFHSKRCVCEP